MPTKARPTAGRPRTTRSSAPPPSDLELRAAAVRYGTAHYTETLAVPCPDGHAPAGQPCSPPTERGPRARGGFCPARGGESARAAGQLSDLAQEAFAAAMLSALDAYARQPEPEQPR